MQSSTGTIVESMTLEEKLIAHRALSQKIHELEEERKALGQEILKEMPSEKLELPDFTARVCSRLSIKIPIEQARMFDATQMVEQVDKEKIKEIYKSGVALDGVEEISYLVTTSNKKVSAQLLQ